MDDLHCTIPQLKLRQPLALSPRLFFQVFNGPNAIAHAHLSARQGREARVSCGRPDESSAPGITYCLTNIEVSQAYRNRGVGTALLDEVLRFCRDSQVSSIYGEAKGDLGVLRKWYKGSGFQLSQQDHIQLHMREEVQD